MKIADAQRNLSLYDFGDKRAEAIGTQLRSAELLPKGGRGPHAPEANEGQVALYTLAVAGARKVSDAVDTAAKLAHIENAAGTNLLRAVTLAISDPQQAAAIRHIRVFPNMPMAELTRPDGTVEYFFDPSLWQPDFAPEAQGQAYVGPIGHIGGAVLIAMAGGFKQPIESGWTKSDNAGEING